MYSVTELLRQQSQQLISFIYNLSYKGKQMLGYTQYNLLLCGV